MRNKPLPVFFCASNALGLGASPPLLLAPARFLCPLGVVGSPRSACRLSGRAAGRGLSCRRAVRWGLSLVARSPCRLAGRRAACPAFLVSWFSAGGRTACRRVACPAGFVPVNRRGRRGGSLVAICLLGWSRRGVCGLCELPFLG